MSVQDIYTKELADIKAMLAALTTKGKERLIAWIVVGVLAFILVYALFFRSGVKDFSGYADERRHLLDSIQKLQDQAGQLDQQREEVLKQNEELQQRNRTLENAYISNQEKHVIINQKKNEISPAVNGLSKDSLRKLFTGH
jgi:hypothetical protein